MAQAPFHARPDGVQPGDLRGPFDGQVVDSGTGKPIEGATVVVSWALRAGRGLSGPARTEVATVDTDADGRYRVARLAGSIGLREALERVTLVIYKKGFLGWRSDRRFADLSARTDFAQSQSVARLEHLPADISHVRHLAWLGASGPLLARAAWELPLAAEELAPSAEAAAPGETPAPRPADTTPEAHLDGRVLLSQAELKAVSGYKGAFTVEPLPDVPSSPTYDSVHFRAVGQPEKFDAAIRVWKLPGDGAEARFNELAKELPKAVPSKDVGDRSLRSAEGPLLAVATLNRAEGVVLLFTCGRALCTDHGQVAAVVRRMSARTSRLAQTTKATRADEPLPVQPMVPSLPRPPVAEPAPVSPPTVAAPVKRVLPVKKWKKGKRVWLRRGAGKGRAPAVAEPGAEPQQGAVEAAPVKKLGKAGKFKKAGKVGKFGKAGKLGKRGKGKAGKGKKRALPRRKP